MKKTIILFVLIGLMTSNAIAAKKKVSPQEKRAKQMTEFVAQKMELTDLKRKVLFDALVAKVTASKELKELSADAKKEANKQIRTNFIASLGEQFSKEEIKQVNDLLKEFSTQAKEAKKE